MMILILNTEKERRQNMAVVQLYLENSGTLDLKQW